MSLLLLNLQRNLARRIVGQRGQALNVDFLPPFVVQDVPAHVDGRHGLQRSVMEGVEEREEVESIVLYSLPAWLQERHNRKTVPIINFDACVSRLCCTVRRQMLLNRWRSVAGSSGEWWNKHVCLARPRLYFIQQAPAICSGLWRTCCRRSSRNRQVLYQEVVNSK